MKARKAAIPPDPSVTPAAIAMAAALEQDASIPRRLARCGQGPTPQDGAPGARATGLAERDRESRPPECLPQASRDDPDNPGVPALAADDDDGSAVVGQADLRKRLGLGDFQRRAFKCATVTVQPVEHGGDLGRL